MPLEIVLRCLESREPRPLNATSLKAISEEIKFRMLFGTKKASLDAFSEGNGIAPEMNAGQRGLLDPLAADHGGFTEHLPGCPLLLFLGIQSNA
jgi:hypothetical protein